ncbi:alpha-glucosidase [Virgibacillus soli]|uniref:glycoside hydrolase family 13 protein n=1 Tax=Paracerasibacillus soli TaxID=480284 RepID=UPI0035F034FF
MKKVWWKEAVAYQIYPRSFMDSNGDGIGDLQGVIKRLDYLQDLGIDVIWICPMYQSPNDDNGYDISDYQAIMAEFGTMADFNELLDEVHKRGMKLIIDLVINHTSDEHPWFIESRSSKNNPKRDWYIWRDGKDGKEPNNWESIFGGSAWKYDAKTAQYFLHLFSKKQPDLNWENKAVRHALYDMVNWWLDKGIDGFRVDAISHIKKEPGLPDLPNPNGEKYVPSFPYHMNVEGIQPFLQELKENTFAKYDIMTVGEANGVSLEQADEWVGEAHGKFNMIFQFEHLDLWNTGASDTIDLIRLKQILAKWQKGLENNGWNALFIENHDLVRVVSALGDDKRYWKESATALATMYFFMQGTPFIYQGQEIGMTNVQFSTIEDYNDVKTVNQYYLEREAGKSHEEIMETIWKTSRDNTRTPMQWSGTEEHAGFTTGKPWLRVNENYRTINVADQLHDKTSIYHFYKRMIQLRKAQPVFVYGTFALILEDDPNIFAYTRTLQDEKVLVITNISAEKVMFSYDGIVLKNENILLHNAEITAHETEKLTLQPYEARVYLI